ncbi:MAG: nascent polypeptide-associated complex protein, partial [Candidatus Thermoplasmatota archaeon]|nr:nascent polypeptide-associated complex protein [Candidatus Thermoplasmatota archaeon]
EIPEVEELVIKTPQRDYIFRAPSVTIMKAQGSKTYQFAGEPEIREKASAAPQGGEVQATQEAKAQISEEDVALVAQQTSKTPEQARKMLEETNGDIAEAIIRLSSQ